MFLLDDNKTYDMFPGFRSIVDTLDINFTAGAMLRILYLPYTSISTMNKSRAVEMLLRYGTSQTGSFFTLSNACFDVLIIYPVIAESVKIKKIVISHVRGWAEK